MRCSDLRRQLARLERLDKPSNEARANLSRCEGCRAWYQKLLRVERQVPLIATPPARGKSAFVNRVLSGAVKVGKTRPEVLPLRPTAARPSPRSDRERHQQKLALATALAAGLLVFAASFGALQWQPTKVPATSTVLVVPPPMPDVLQAGMKEFEAVPPTDVALRLEKLVDVARTIHNECHKLAESSNTSDLRAMLGWYREVFQDHIITQARAVPVGERIAVLGDVTSELDRFRQETENVANMSAEPTAGILRSIAAVAGNTAKDLRTL